jgi:hypothetical protein
MITNEQYLIQRYAEAREKQIEYVTNDTGRLYWKGVMDTYHSLLTHAFSDWAVFGSVGYYVFYEGHTYDEALAASEKNRDAQPMDQSKYNSLDLDESGCEFDY